MKKASEIDKKKVPKDQTAAKKKADEKKAELIKEAEDNFSKLLEAIRKENPGQDRL